MMESGNRQCFIGFVSYQLASFMCFNQMGIGMTTRKIKQFGSRLRKVAPLGHKEHCHET